jgi:hypothetical protein
MILTTVSTGTHPDKRTTDNWPLANWQNVNKLETGRQLDNCRVWKNVTFDDWQSVERMSCQDHLNCRLAKCRGQLLISTLGAKYMECCTPLRSFKQTIVSNPWVLQKGECSPLRIKVPYGGQVHPWGPSSPLGACSFLFPPRPPGAKLGH